MTGAILRLVIALLPAPLHPWGEAMRAEAEAIAPRGAALRFALGCLGFALRETLRFHLLHPLGLLRDGGASNDGEGDDLGLGQRPWRMAAACAVAATGLGLVYLSLAGAPIRYLAINVGALLIGFVLVAIALLGRRSGYVTAGAVCVALGALLLLTSLIGAPAEGATRWIAVGPLFIQPSLILLPAATLAFARARDVTSTVGIIAAAAALALQPDRAMAGALAGGLLALVLIRPERTVRVALAAASIGFLVTLLRPDGLPAMPYVDRILYSSFTVSPLAGIAVFAGVALMVVPAVVGRFYDADHREAYAVFGAVWLTVIAAAALGNYPTPVVGYGGSAIIGYVVSLLGLPRVALRSRAPVETKPPARPRPKGERCAPVGYVRT